VVRSVTGEDVDMERLGGAEPHSRRSAMAHVVTQTDAEALLRARELVTLLGDQGTVAGNPETATCPSCLIRPARV
jgi:acetyl-CoA/propionyl-CoA carboxylase carboxyl transferase subunit